MDRENLSVKEQFENLFEELKSEIKQNISDNKENKDTSFERWLKRIEELVDLIQSNFPGISVAYLEDLHEFIKAQGVAAAERDEEVFYTPYNNQLEDKIYQAIEQLGDSAEPGTYGSLINMVKNDISANLEEKEAKPISGSRMRENGYFKELCEEVEMQINLFLRKLVIFVEQGLFPEEEYDAISRMLKALPLEMLNLEGSEVSFTTNLIQNIEGICETYKNVIERSQDHESAPEKAEEQPEKNEENISFDSDKSPFDMDDEQKNFDEDRQRILEKQANGELRVLNNGYMDVYVIKEPVFNPFEPDEIVEKGVVCSVAAFDSAYGSGFDQDDKSLVKIVTQKTETLMTPEEKKMIDKIIADRINGQSREESSPKRQRNRRLARLHGENKNVENSDVGEIE